MWQVGGVGVLSHGFFVWQLIEAEFSPCASLTVPALHRVIWTLGPRAAVNYRPLRFPNRPSPRVPCPAAQWISTTPNSPSRCLRAIRSRRAPSSDSSSSNNGDVFIYLLFMTFF